MLAIVKCVHHKVGLYRSGITDVRPLRVVYALGELVCLADRGIAVAVDSEVAAEVDSAEGWRVGVVSRWMSSEWFSLEKVCELEICRRC